MKKQIVIAALLLGLGLSAIAVAAETPQTETPKKFWVMPTVGVRGSGNFDVNSEEQPYTSIKFGSGVSYGLALGYRISDILAVEVAWNRSTPDIFGLADATETDPAVNDLLFGSTEDQLHANLLLSTGYKMGQVKPFFLLALGMTGLNPQTNNSELQPVLLGPRPGARRSDQGPVRVPRPGEFRHDLHQRHRRGPGRLGGRLPDRLDAQHDDPVGVQGRPVLPLLTPTEPPRGAAAPPDLFRTMGPWTLVPLTLARGRLLLISGLMTRKGVIK